MLRKWKIFGALILLLFLGSILFYFVRGKSEASAVDQESGREAMEERDVLLDDDPVQGSAEASVTIVEFADFECPFCLRFFRQTYPLIQERYIDSGKVKVIYRDFPLDAHPHAQKAAEAAECADEQGKFWEYHDLLFQNQQALSVADLKSYARQLGLNPARFDECLDSGKYAEEVKRDRADGISLGVSGTPTFFINGKKFIGAQPFSAFEEVIQKALEESSLTPSLEK